MKLALFGGTFDPVHRGHLAIARAAAAKFDLDVVYFVPADVPPHKGNRNLTEFQHRFAMLALATAEEKRFVPSLLEANSGQPNYSIRTVRRLKSFLNKSDTLYFLIGIDAFMEISTWKQPVQLLAECDFIVASRPGHALADLVEALPEGVRPSGAVLQAFKRQQASGTIALSTTRIHVLPDVNEAVSSTQIRAASRKSIQQLSRYVPASVARYIKKEHLYTSTSAQRERVSVKDGKVLSFRRAQDQQSREQG
ncbi:MAG TPA: nicotinate-nucleotide adenylyltransferase [Candidatus Angelobacter sp.]